MRCAIHHDVETSLSCGRCGRPICPKCMVMTLVGARCPACAKLKRPPTYQLSAVWYLRAAGGGLASAVGVGLVWSMVIRSIPFAGFFGIIIAAAAGYLIGEATSRSVNRKRGLPLAITGSLAFILSYFISVAPFAPLLVILRLDLFDLVALGLGVFLAQNQLR